MDFGDVGKLHGDIDYILNTYDKELLEEVEHVCTHLKKKIDGEEAQIAAQKKLARTLPKKGTFLSALHTHLARQDDAEIPHRAKYIEETAQTIARIREGEKAYKKEREERRRAVKEEVRRWDKTSEAVNKAQRKSNTLKKEADEARRRFEKADADMNVTKAFVQKTYNEHRARDGEAVEAQRKYTEEAERTKEDYQRHYFETLPELLRAVQAADERLLETVRAMLLGYVNAAAAREHSVATDNLQLGQSIEDEDLGKEMRRVASAFLPEPETEPETPKKNAGVRLPSTARALYAFVPLNPQEELELQEGAVVKILEKQEGWWLAQAPDGRTGFVPQNYVEEIN
ncbi:MAG: uncharacterized protein A8A55_0245 [Amphiamblys sp. WSBS2006]|nr:MAG: uncharacterized protein A8A55_0245 [Amphiamblys sp. WSBS2006]